jgi:hypothetical protein
MRYLLVAVYAAAPLAALGADNGRLISVPDLAPYYLGVVVPALLATAVVAWRRGRVAADTTAVCLAIATLVVFDYWDLRPTLKALTHDSRPSMVFLWAVVLGVAMVITTHLARRASRLPSILVVAGLVILVPSLISWADEDQGKATRVARVTAHTRQTLTVRHAPNVYFFMLDAYGRADRLREQFGFDNTPFLRSLRSQGFVVPSRTQSSYAVTALSVPTMLQMNYVISHGTLDAESTYPIFAGHNAVTDTFRSLGYSFAHAPSDLPNWTCDGSEDLCIHATQTYASHLGVSQLVWAIMERTPAADLLRSVAPVHLNPLTERRQFPLRVARTVLNRPPPRPVFTFAHVLLTHWPYLYLGPNCRLAATRGKLGAKAYVQAIECANADTQAAVKLILKRDPGAAIVLASDHGSDVDVPGDQAGWDWPGLAVTRRYSNFTALRLPRACRSDVPDQLFEADIFRVVFNCLTDPKLPPVEPRRYFSAVGLEVRPDPAFRR